MAKPAAAQPELPFFDGCKRPEDEELRSDLIARWLHLVRDVLPGLSDRHHWPISRDHCFMRVCLDTALNAPWRSIIQPPAIQNLTVPQLKAAIAVAESIVAAPERLAALNRQSIGRRRQQMPPHDGS